MYFLCTFCLFLACLSMSLKVPSIVEEARRALAEGHCVVVGLQTTGEVSEVADLGSRWLCWSMWRGLCLMGAHMSRLWWSYAHLDIASWWHPLESPVIEWTSHLTVCGNISHIHSSTPYAYLPSWEMIGTCTLCACLSTGQFIKWGVSHWPAKGFHLTHQGDPAQLPREPLSSGSAQTGTTATLLTCIAQYVCACSLCGDTHSAFPCSVFAAQLCVYTLKLVKSVYSCNWQVCTTLCPCALSYMFVSMFVCLIALPYLHV